MTINTLLWRLGSRLGLPVAENPPLPKGTPDIWRPSHWAIFDRSPDSDVLLLFELQMFGLMAAPRSREDHAARFQRGRLLERLTLEQREYALAVARGVVALLNGVP